MDNSFSNCTHKNILYKSSSLPIFNTRNRFGIIQRLPSCYFRDSTNEDSKYIFSPDNMKLLMMEDKLKKLERENSQQVDKINTLLSYQINERQNKLFATFVPTPNVLLFPNNNLFPLQYARELDKYYDLRIKRKNKKKLFLMKIQNQQKDNEIKKYRKEINSLKDLLKMEKMKKRINRNMFDKLYIPIKEDISNLQYDLHKTIKKRINENNAMNNSINEIQNSYDEIKNVLMNKLDKLKLRQKTEFDNLKNEFIKKIRINQEQEKNLRSKLKEQLVEEIRTQRELDDIRHQRELEEMKRKQDIEDMENNKLMEEMKFNKIKYSILNQRKKIPQIIHQYPTPYFQMSMPLWDV